MVLLSIGLTLVGVLVLSAIYSAIQSWRIEQRYPPIGSFVTVDGVRLHYLDLPADDPDQPTLVFIHGASGNLREPAMAFRPALSGKYRLLFVDRPGHGWSERGDRAMAAPRRQAQLVLDLMRARGIERAVVVGHSWGTAVAAILAAEHPEAVSGLMLLAPATHPWPGGVEWYYTLATTPIVGPLFTRTVMLPIAQILAEGSMRQVFAPGPEPAGYLDKAGIPLVFRAGEFTANAEDVADLKANLIAQWPRYASIQAPTGIVAGAGDTVVRNELHAEALARQIKGARLVTLADAGHMPQFADPAVVLDLLEDLADRTRTHGFASVVGPVAALSAAD